MVHPVKGRRTILNSGRSVLKKHPLKKKKEKLWKKNTNLDTPKSSNSPSSQLLGHSSYHGFGRAQKIPPRELAKVAAKAISPRRPCSSWEENPSSHLGVRLVAANVLQNMVCCSYFRLDQAIRVLHSKNFHLLQENATFEAKAVSQSMDVQF